MKKNLRDGLRAAFPTIALCLLSAVFSGQVDSARREGLIPRNASVVRMLQAPSLDDLDDLAAAARAAARPFYNPRPEHIARFKPIIEDAARRYDLDPLLLHAVIRAESGYNPDAVSPRGAAGLMQLIPETGLRYGAKDLFNPRQNVRAGARYLRDLLEMFGNDLELALAGYNAGEGSVIKAGRRIPSFPETAAYVPKVLDFYRAARGEADAKKSG